MTIRLRCLSYYRNDPLNVVHQPGEEFDATDERARYLLRDSPQSFERVKAPDSPPANKAVLEPDERKSDGDDFTVISGISDARQRSLRLVGIRTYADLAAADVDTLTDLHGVGEQTAREWIREASDLA